jgi:hypothetical protein
VPVWQFKNLIHVFKGLIGAESNGKTRPTNGVSSSQNESREEGSADLLGETSVSSDQLSF